MLEWMKRRARRKEYRGGSVVMTRLSALLQDRERRRAPLIARAGEQHCQPINRELIQSVRELLWRGSNTTQRHRGTEVLRLSLYTRQKRPSEADHFPCSLNDILYAHVHTWSRETQMTYLRCISISFLYFIYCALYLVKNANDPSTPLLCSGCYCCEIQYTTLIPYHSIISWSMKY